MDRTERLLDLVALLLDARDPVSFADLRELFPEEYGALPRASAERMTPEQWRHFVLSTAGSITDPTFVRHEQGEYERREELP